MRRQLAAWAATLVFIPAVAAAVEPAVPAGVVNLQASAAIEVPQDTMRVTLAVTRDGTDAASVQAALRQALDAALTEARRAARPGQLEVQTGAFSLYPRSDDKGRITRWQGTAELILEGRDMPAIGALAGRITTMNVARVAYALSRTQREAVENDAAAQAIARFRAKAQEVAKQFGYAGFAIREVQVSSSEPPVGVVPVMARAKAMSASADESLPVEAGKATVSVVVSGSVQMK